MRRERVGGYQGPVLVLSADGVQVARAACRYRAEPDLRGEDKWHGRLHRIDPPGAVIAGSYRLQFPQGDQGEVVVEDRPPVGDVVYFVGSGDRPLNPL